MRLNQLFIWLALLTGLLVLGRSLELDANELRDHYQQEQMTIGNADPVSFEWPAPVQPAFVPVVGTINRPPPTCNDGWLAAPRRSLYEEPPPPPRRFLRLCTLLI